MANRPAAREQGVIDPMFPIPEGLGEFTYADPENYLINVPSEEESADYSYSETSDDVEVEDDLFIVEDDLNYYEQPDTVEEFAVVSEVVRTLSDGTQVVDVVIEVEDIPGAVHYDFRVVTA